MTLEFSMSTALRPQRAATFWPRLWDRLLVFEGALSTTSEDISDRRITRLETELAAVRKELTTLRAQEPHTSAVSGRGQARD